MSAYQVSITNRRFVLLAVMSLIASLFAVSSHAPAAQATNEKIRRMRQGQLSNAEADYQRRLAELDEAVKKADLNAEPVAYGVVILGSE